MDAGCADLSERTDETRETDDAAVSEQLGHLRDTSDVLFAVLGTEAEVLVESVANVVSVQTVRRNSLTHQVAFQRERQSRLASARQSCHPYNVTVLGWRDLA